MTRALLVLSLVFGVALCAAPALSPRMSIRR